MVSHKPKDYQLAEAAFKEYKPEVTFDELNHEAQMKWVRVSRSILGMDEEFSRKHNPTHSKKERAASRLPRAKKKSPKQMGAKVSELEAANAIDRKILTDTRWKDKPEDELKAIWRIQARDRRIKHLNTLNGA